MLEKRIKSPNILWICTDQQRFDTLGCYGNPYVKTPNIDRLAEMGVQFEKAYSQSPVCTPSRASFLTGRYPRTTRCRQNGQDIPEDELLITKILSDEGYTCGLSGKLHLSSCHQSVCPSMERRIADGYSEFRWSHHPEYSWPTNEYNIWLNNKGKEFKPKSYNGSKNVQIGLEEEDHQTTWCVEKAVEFIESNSKFNNPWLFSVNIFDPHHPFNPPKKYLERYLEKFDEIPLPNYVEGELDNKPLYQKMDHKGSYNNPRLHPFIDMDDKEHRLIRAAYWAMIDLIDAQVGRLIDVLEKTGQLQDTLIIFTSDHGEMLGDHGIYLKGPFFYEAAVHVPLIISWPGVIEGGRRSTALVELVDLAPTLLEALNMKVHPGMQGISLWSILKGQAPEDIHRKDVYGEYYNAMPWHKNPNSQATMVFDGRYKLVKMHSTKEGELYDLQKDPSETVNLWYDKEYTEIKLNMIDKLCDRMAWTVDPLPLRKSEW